MEAYVFGSPVQMPHKLELYLFGGAYVFTIEGATQTGAFRFVTATIVPNPRVKVPPEVLDTIPTILDIYEYCDKTSFVEFLLSIIFNGVIDPYYTGKEVHIRDDRGLILIRARIVPDLMCSSAVDASNSYAVYQFVQRLGKMEFFISGQEYDFPSQSMQMATITIAHSPLSINDGWRGFNYPHIDWISVYKEFIYDLEMSLHQDGMHTRTTEEIISKYVKYATVFETSVTADQLSVRIVQYPRTMMGIDVLFPAEDPNAVMLKIPADGTDPLQYWRQIAGNLYPGLIPLLMACTGTVVHNGESYIYLNLNRESNGVSNAWAFHHTHSIRPNAMSLFPEAGETNTVDMSIRVDDRIDYNFSGSFYPFLENGSSLAILNSGNNDFPYIIGVLECEFVEDIDEPGSLTAVIINPAGSFLSNDFVTNINQWMGLPADEPWVLFNYVAKPNLRFYQVAVQHQPHGMTASTPNSLPESKPASNEIKTPGKAKRWKFW